MATSIASPVSAEPAGAPSVSDLLGMIPSGAMESASTYEEPAKEGIEPDEPVDDGQIETPEPAAEPEAAPEPEPAPEPPEPPKETAVAPEEVEGVTKGKNRKGEEGYFVTPAKWEKVYNGSHKTAQQVSEFLGEPLTLESIQGKVRDADSWNFLINDLASGDKTAQDNSLNYLLERMSQAHRNGETAVDPSVSFVDTLYGTLAKAGTDSAAYRTMRLRNTQDLARELYEGAARSNDNLLAASVQHVVRHLAGIGPSETNPAVIKAAAERMGLPFHLIDELPTLAKGTSPEARLRQENAQLRAQVSGRAAPASETFSQWDAKATGSVQKAVMDTIIAPALAAQKEAWSKLPDGAEQFEIRIVKPLQDELNGVLAKDERYQQQLTSLKEQAKRATSVDVRQRIADQMATITKNRANISIEAIKAKHVKFATDAIVRQSESTHQRKTNAQLRTVPRGASAPVNRGIVPANEVTYKDGVFDPATAMQDMKSRVQRLVS